MIGVALTTLGLAVLGRMMVLEVQHVRRGLKSRATSVLAMMIVLVVMTFSLAFYLVELLDPGQFVGLASRVDSLYFTLSTMTTIGYGDIHAAGQLARAMVTGLIVFNVVVVASLLRVLTRRDA